MKSPRRVALLRGAGLNSCWNKSERADLSDPQMGNPNDVLFVLYSVPITFVAISELVWAPVSLMPLGLYSKVVI
eukprot:423232-Pelagomonas_calceolata.AAC.1